MIARADAITVMILVLGTATAHPAAAEAALHAPAGERVWGAGREPFATLHLSMSREQQIIEAWADWYDKASKFILPEPPPEPRPVVPDEEEPDAGWTLANIVVVGDERRAVLQDAWGRLRIYGPKAVLDDGTVVLAISADTVTLRSARGRATLTAPGARP